MCEQEKKLVVVLERLNPKVLDKGEIDNEKPKLPKQYLLRQKSKEFNYSLKIKDETSEQDQWSDFSSGSSDNFTVNGSEAELNSSSDEAPHQAKILQQPTGSGENKTTKKINVLSQYRLFPDANEKVIVEEINAPILSLNKNFDNDDYVIPFAKDVNVPSKILKEKICNVGFESTPKEVNTKDLDFSIYNFSDKNEEVFTTLNNNSISTCQDMEKTTEETEAAYDDFSSFNIVEGNLQVLSKQNDAVLNKNNAIDDSPDGTLINFGKILNKQLPKRKVEHTTENKYWSKKNACPYCLQCVTHFPRHLEKHHKNEGAVKKLITLTGNKSERQLLLDNLRRQGNYLCSQTEDKVLPVRQPRKGTSLPNIKNISDDDYVACPNCLGYFKKNYLRRHRKHCAMLSLSENSTNRLNHLSEAQIFAVCCGTNSTFYNSLRLKKEVFPIMRSDEISKTAIEDVLICSYAEDLLGKHKRVQIKNVISNKMRELGRLLIQLKKTTGATKIIDVFKPEFFDSIVSATKVISGYDCETKNYKAGSLALHMGTTLKQLCDTATKLIIKKSPLLLCKTPEETLKLLKRIRSLITNHWNMEVASLALKNLNEKKWEKPKMFPLTKDLLHFEKYVLDIAKTASQNLKQKLSLKKNYRLLSEAVLALTVLLNRKRIGEVQYLTIGAYNNKSVNNQQEEFLQSLSESEKILTKHFKRVVTSGKGSKPVPILFSKVLQDYLDLLLEVRDQCVPKTNLYLFANPQTDNKSISGYHTLKKLAEHAGIENTELFTSTRLRKQIATVLQVMNISENEMEQFASFMGHTKKTHENYYRLPQDIYQTAKVSKLLLAINKGKGAEFKGKTLEEIDLSDNVDSDSDEDADTLNQMQKTTKQIDTTLETPSTSTNLPNVDDSKNQVANISIFSSDEDESFDDPSPKRAKIQRIKWNDKQKAVLKEYFKKHISCKKSPKKHEVEELQRKHKKLFAGRNWVVIKAFVYNCYKKQ